MIDTAEKILSGTLAGVLARVADLDVAEEFVAALRELFAGDLAALELQRIGEGARND